jgi:hypothetical protein
MLVDFLKGNHFSKVLATLLWLWKTKGLIDLGPERWIPGVASGRYVRYKYLLMWQMLVGPDLWGRPGRWMISEGC